MALLTASKIAALNVGLLVRDLRLANTVSRIPGGDYAGDNGDTVTVRVRQTRTAQKQSTPGGTINYSSQSEIPVPVTLAHVYDGVNITDQELSMDIRDFGVQIAEPSVAAVAVGAEDELVAAMNDLDPDSEIVLSAPDDDDDNTIDAVLAARERLTKNGVPASDRFLAVAPDVATRLLRVPDFRKVNESGSAEALRQGVLGSLFGFTVVESGGLDDGTALAYHRSGFVMATRTPVAPAGAADTGTATYGGFGLRVIRHYNPATATDQMLTSVFVGASVVRENAVQTPVDDPDIRRVVKIATDEGTGTGT